MERKLNEKIRALIPTLPTYNTELTIASRFKKKDPRFNSMIFHQCDFFAYPGYFDDGHAGAGTDFGLIKINDIKKFKTFDFASIAFDRILTYENLDIDPSSNLEIMGYPGESNKCYQLFRSQKIYSSEQEEMINVFDSINKHKLGHCVLAYTHQSSAGQSGGPLLLHLEEMDTPFLIGIHVSGYDEVASATGFCKNIMNWIDYKGFDHFDVTSIKLQNEKDFIVNHLNDYPKSETIGIWGINKHFGVNTNSPLTNLNLWMQEHW